MATKPSSSGASSSDSSPGVLDSPGVTKTITIRRTRVCEVITDLTFSVAAFAQLPTPQVPQSEDGILDLRTFTGDATIFIEKWVFMETGQKCWLDCTGKQKDGSDHTVHVMVGKAITAADVKNGLSRTLPRVELEKFANRTQLTIVFKTELDACCEKGEKIIFPALKLTLRKPYRDLTDFNDQTLGLWKLGSGASDPRDINIETVTGPDGKPSYSVRDFTYTETSNGPILQRVFDDLDEGETYQFSVKVRRWSTQYSTPKLSLRKDSVVKTPVLELVDLNWHTLSFTFVAGSAPVLLDCFSHEKTAGGNDWYMKDFLVESV